MKKATKPSTNAVQGAADRMTRGALHADDDLWRDEPDQDTDKPAEASGDTHTVARQRRRPRGRKA